MPTASKRKTPVCVYWDADTSLYRIYLAEYVRGEGWMERTYLGSARSLEELRDIFVRFGYRPVCGIEV